MSFVIAAPDLVERAASDLIGIRSLLAEAASTAAFPTTGIASAAHDEVSIAVAAMFGDVGREFQVLSARAQLFHAQFVELMNAGAGAYAAAETANAAQALLNGGIGGVEATAGQFGGSVSACFNGAVGAAQADFGAASAAILAAPAVLSGAAQTGAHGVSAAVSANAFAGQIAGPYETLLANTVRNLQTIGTTMAADPFPFANQFIINQTGYAQTIATAIGTTLQNLPTELAALPATLQTAVHDLLAFNPVPYLHQIVDNQFTYAQIWATSLQNAAHDFGTGLQQLPAAFQSACHALATGNVGGAAIDLGKGFGKLFVTGVDTSTTGNPVTGLTADVRLTGALADLSPILAVPGMRTAYLTGLLPPGSIPAQMTQHLTNVLDTVTDTSLVADVGLKPVLRPPFFTFSVTATAGLPTALALDALGAPVNAANAFGASTTAFADAVQTGNWPGAAAALIDAPALVTNGFLNGHSTLPVTFNVSGNPATVNFPLNGILDPPTPYTATVTVPPGVPITVTVGGTPISGLATGLLVYAPQQLAKDIGAG